MLSDISPTKTLKYTGVGVYPFPFLVYLEEDLLVQHLDETGALTILTSGDYTFSTLEPTPGGSINVTNASLGNGRIIMQRVLSIEQITDWVNNDDFSMKLLEKTQDRLVMMMQQLKAMLSDVFSSVKYRGNWLADFDYTEWEIVVGPDGNWYSCLIPHKSSTFVDDLAEGYWVMALPLTDFTDKYNTVVAGVDQVGLDRTAVEDAAAQVMADKQAVASDKATVAADKQTVASDKATVAADKATTISAKDAAVAAKGVTETARDQAVAAQGVTETARDQAVAAKDATLTAQGVTEGARDTTVAAKDATLTAQGITEGARDAAIAAKDAAIAAQGLSEDARDASVVAQGLSEGAKDTSVAAAATATQAADDAEQIKADLSASVLGTIGAYHEDPALADVYQTSGAYTVPVGVYRLKVKVHGTGGAGGVNDRSAGTTPGTTSFASGTDREISATGGNGGNETTAGTGGTGYVGASVIAGGTGVGATGEDDGDSLPAGDGGYGWGESTGGAGATSTGSSGGAGTYGGGGGGACGGGSPSDAGAGGGEGGWAYGDVDVTPGEQIAIVIAAQGTQPDYGGKLGGAGGLGYVMIWEY